jgi:formylglycine-generating enzyme required for sulfatase activity
MAIDLGGGVRMELVLISAGEFMMGSPDSERHAGSDEKPEHRVRITKPFYLGKYQLTQEEWQRVMSGNPSFFKGPRNPVEGVNWDRCQAFLGRLNQQYARAGGTFRLPTEGEWEYACRAGSSTRWCFGDQEGSLEDYAWCVTNSGSSTHPVGQKRPNAWGLYDMHGNVWEWCSDWYDVEYYGESPRNDPTGPSSASYRVCRGGGWDGRARFCRSANRDFNRPGSEYSFLGFRVCLEAVE